MDRQMLSDLVQDIASDIGIDSCVAVEVSYMLYPRFESADPYDAETTTEITIAVRDVIREYL